MNRTDVDLDWQELLVQTTARVVGINGVHYRGFGPYKIRGLVEAGLIDKPFDIFELKGARIQKAADWPDVTVRRFERIRTTPRRVALPNAIYAVCAPHISASTAYALACAYGKLSAVIYAQPGELERKIPKRHRLSSLYVVLRQRETEQRVNYLLQHFDILYT